MTAKLDELLKGIQENWASQTTEELERAERSRLAAERSDRKLRVQERLHESRIDRSVKESVYQSLLIGAPLDETPAMQAVKSLVIDRDNIGPSMRFLVLLGATGRGKTVACAWLVAEHGGSYVKADRFSRLYAAGYDSAQIEFDKLVSSTNLVIDDLGTERNREAAEGAIYRAADERIFVRGAGLTVLTSNLGKAEFCERYGARTIERIEEQGALLVVGGDNLRRKQ